MSHEIRTPMNGVVGTAELLERENLSERQKRLVGTVRSSAAALLRIIDDVLDFSKIEAGRMELEEAPFSLRGLIEGKGASRDFAFHEWDLSASRCGVELKLRTVRTRTHKLTVEQSTGAGELYDLANDPHEMDNRFDDPGCAKVRKELEAMIASRPDDARTERLPAVGMA